MRPRAMSEFESADPVMSLRACHIERYEQGGLFAPRRARAKTRCARQRGARRIACRAHLERVPMTFGMRCLRSFVLRHIWRMKRSVEAIVSNGPTLKRSARIGEKGSVYPRVSREASSALVTRKTAGARRDQLATPSPRNQFTPAVELRPATSPPASRPRWRLDPSSPPPYRRCSFPAPRPRRSPSCSRRR